EGGARAPLEPARKGLEHGRLVHAVGKPGWRLCEGLLRRATSGVLLLVDLRLEGREAIRKGPSADLRSRLPHEGEGWEQGRQAFGAGGERLLKGRRLRPRGQPREQAPHLGERAFGREPSRRRIEGQIGQLEAQRVGQRLAVAAVDEGGARVLESKLL